MTCLKAFCLCLAALIACIFLTAQSVDWQWLCHSSGVDFEYCTDIAVDGAGNTFVAGTCQGECVFGPFSHTETGYFGFVAKADAEGNWLWLQWTNASAAIRSIEAIELDAAGNAYVTGIFSGNITLGSMLLHSFDGSWDVFTAKLSPGGTWLWAKKAGEAETDECYGLALDSYANVYVAGRTGTDAFLIVYTGTGVPVGGVAYSCTDHATSEDIAVDAAGNVFMAGEFSGSITFGTTTLTSAGGDDIFIVKITSAGNVDWAKRAGGTNNDRVKSLCLDSLFAVYLTGSFYGTAAFGTDGLISAGGSDIFVAKLGSAGAWLGALRAGATDNDSGNAIAVASASEIYLAGDFSDTVAFGGTTLTQVGTSDSEDMFVARLTSAGAWLWAKGAGSTSVDSAKGLAIDPNGELRVGGIYGSEMTVGNQVLPDADPDGYNSEEVFLIKIGSVIPREPENLALAMDGGDAVLSWNPVTQTIYGQLVTPDEYMVYRSSTGLIEGPYTELGSTPLTSYTHEYVGLAEPRSFYRVGAYQY